MLHKKWLYNFEHSLAHCQLKYHGKLLGEIPMTGNLLFLDVKFIRPDAPPENHVLYEISAFVHSPLS